MDMSGRVALITGAGQGVGRAIAMEIAAHGAAVSVNDYFEDRARQVAAEIEDGGGKAMCQATCQATSTM